MTQEKETPATPDSVEVTSLISFYDREEIIPNCTVQILTNTQTGEVSVDWWRNEQEEETE